VDAETPVSLHGDIDEKPIPAPNATSSSVNAAAATVPAATAGHETPDCASTVATAALAGQVVASIAETPGKGVAEPLAIQSFQCGCLPKVPPVLS
jgi:hypothetical protein